jgi:hypothetical protein
MRGRMGLMRERVDSEGVLRGVAIVHPHENSIRIGQRSRFRLSFYRLLRKVLLCNLKKTNELVPYLMQLITG